jgi:uncharacterized protein YndB with AHSA1/START domain
MTLHLERELPVGARAAFEPWLDPAALAVFMCPAEGMHVSKVEVDPRVGGEFLIVMNIGGRALPHHGKYLAIERHTRLAFTWHSHHAGADSRVTLTFTPLGPRKTRVVLEHVGLDGDAVSRHTNGWTAILAALERCPIEPPGPIVP